MGPASCPAILVPAPAGDLSSYPPWSAGSASPSRRRRPRSSAASHRRRPTKAREHPGRVTTTGGSLPEPACPEVVRNEVWRHRHPCRRDRAEGWVDAVDPGPRPIKGLPLLCAGSAHLHTERGEVGHDRVFADVNARQVRCLDRALRTEGGAEAGTARAKGRPGSPPRNTRDVACCNRPCVTTGRSIGGVSVGGTCTAGTGSRSG